MHIRAYLILFIFLVSSSSGVLASSGRSSPQIDYSLSKHDWNSNEKIVVSATIRDAPYNSNFTISWNLKGENGNTILTDTQEIKTSGSSADFNIEISKFFTGDHFYELQIISNNWKSNCFWRLIK
jgi:hypothetical protein